MSNLNKVTLPVGLVLLGLLLMACQPAATSMSVPEVSTGVTSEIQSLEDVTAGEPPQIVDITDADAVLIFESSIPLACSVV